jgi:hypothetical protein
MKIHNEIEEWMAAAVTGALTPEEQQAFARHLAECPRCHALFAEEQKMNTMLNETMAKARPDAQFEQRMVRAFRTTGAGEGWRSRLGQGFFALMRLRPMQAGLAVLGLMALVQGGALLTGEKFQVPDLGQPVAVAANAVRGPAQRELMVVGSITGSSAIGKMEQNRDAGLLGLSLGSLSENYGISAINGENMPMPSASPGVDFNYGRNTDGGNNLNQVLTPVLSKSLADTNGAPGGAGGTTLNYAAFQDQKQRTLADANRSTTLDATGTMDYQNAYVFRGKKTDVTATDAQTPTLVTASPAPVAPEAVDPRKLIRDASLELEVASFDRVVATIATLAAGDGGYVATQNSDRGPNGKLQGQIVVKVPPEKLDALLAELRGLGDLKNQAVGTQDVTKEYFDTAARLRNAQTMEDRLVDLLKTKTGKVSEMLEVERELGRVRGQIEQMQGQLKLYDTLVAFATVTVVVREKDLNQPAAYVQKERATLALFAPDVEAAFAQARQIASEAKAQIAQSQMTRDDRGRREATLSIFVAPENAADAIAKLKGLGRVQNFNDQTERVARDGSGQLDAAKVEHDPVQVNVSIVPDEERTVQQTSVSVQTNEVEAKATQIKQAASTAGATVTNAGFERAANGAELARMTLRLPLRNYAALLEQVKALGEVKDFTVNRQDTGAAGENAPAEIALQIFRPADLVADDNGVWAAMRRTLVQGLGALLWSVRMIGVSLAFLAPWALGLGLVGWLMFRRRR